MFALAMITAEATILDVSACEVWGVGQTVPSTYYSLLVSSGLGQIRLWFKKTYRLEL